MRQIFAEAGLRFRQHGGRISVRSDPSPNLVYALPLQSAEGHLRADAGETLGRDAFGRGYEHRVREHLNRPGVNPADFDHWTHVRLRLLSDTDVLGSVKELTEAYSQCTAFRLGAHPTLMRRQFLWRVIDLLVNRVPAEQMPLGTQRPESMLMTGILEALPGAMMCVPLTARFQPMAAVLMTNLGAEIALLAPGSGFVRTPHMDRWPVGAERPQLSGPGTGVYDVGIRRLPDGHAEALLRLSAAGLNRLLSLLTDPAQFTNAGGILDLDEQMIAWTNVRFGLSAVVELAADWGASDKIWSAFRALGTLQGLWEGATQSSVPLWELLSPDRLRSHALPALPDPTHRAYYAALINNYEKELREGFPGLSLERAVKEVQELRHLVHGTGGQGHRPRDARITTLRHLATNNPNIQLVADMAVLWWTALLFDPDRLCTPGRAPWRP